jgi:hypothetical protein
MIRSTLAASATPATTPRRMPLRIMMLMSASIRVPMNA